MSASPASRISRTFAGSASYPSIWFGARLTFGQAFFPVPRSDVEGTGVSDGVASGVSSGSGVGVGLVFFRFDLLLGVAVGEGVGEAFFRLGEAVGDGVAVGVFAECFRCLRDGVGSG